MMPGSGSRVRREGSWNRACRAENRENPLPSPGAISEPAAIRGEPVISGAEGNFAREFNDARGKIDADLKLGF
jgi:hypothetical protein